MKYYSFKVWEADIETDKLRNYFRITPDIAIGYVFEANPKEALDKIKDSIMGNFRKIYVHQLPKEKVEEFVKAVDEHRREDIERILEEIDKERGI